jgi:hypothetical protein
MARGCFGEPPLAGDRAAALEAVESRIEGALLHAERVLGGVVDPARHGVAMARSPREGLEDQQVEGALQQIERVVGHVFPLSV